MKIRIRTTVPDYSRVNPVAILEEVEEKYAPIALSAVKDAWPDDTGRSDAAWRVSVTTQGAKVVMALTNTTPYAQFVTEKGGKNLLLPALTEKVLADLQPRISVDVSRAVEAAFENVPRKEVNRG